jgi:hypothetical protein
MGSRDGEKVDREANGSQRLYLVRDLGRYGLRCTGCQHHIEFRLGVGDEVQLTRAHGDSSPGALCDAMGPKQTGWDGVLVPLGPRSHESDIFWDFSPVTLRTVERRSYMPFSTFGLEDPLSELKWWTVAHVLIVATGQLGDPLTLLVAVVAGNCSIHEPSVTTHSRGGRRVAEIVENEGFHQPTTRTSTSRSKAVEV